MPEREDASLSTKLTYLLIGAGIGAVGIEALSRGVGFTTFVDKSRKACILIEENLDLLQIPEDKTEVVRADAAEYVKKTEKNFNLVFYDPPYRDNYLEVLSAIAFGTVLTEDGILIVEHESKKDLPDSIGRIRRWRLIKQGSSSLSFYENC